MYLSKPARDMLIRLSQNGSVDYELLYTRELLALLELEHKGLIVEAPNAECQTGNRNEQRSDRNKKAIYAELRLRFVPCFRFFLAALAFAFLCFSFFGKLPLV